MREGKIVRKISRRRVKEMVGYLKNNGGPDGQAPIDLELLKKLKVRKTKKGWIAEIPEKDIRTLKRNLSLLFKNSRDGDLGMIEAVTTGRVYHNTHKGNPLILTYGEKALSRKWNINCGEIGGKIRIQALCGVIDDYIHSHPKRTVFVLVSKAVIESSCDYDYLQPLGVSFVSTRTGLKSLNKTYKNKLSQATLFSDNIKNADKLAVDLHNIEYRGGFYGLDGVQL